MRIAFAISAVLLGMVASCKREPAISPHIVSGLPVLTQELPGYEFSLLSEFALVECSEPLSNAVSLSDKPVALACAANTRLEIIAKTLQKISEDGRRVEIMMLAKTADNSLFRLPFRFPSTPTSERTLPVYLHPQGYVLNSHLVSVRNLRSAIAEAKRADPQQKVIVSWHPTAEFQQFTGLLEACVANEWWELLLEGNPVTSPSTSYADSSEKQRSGENGAKFGQVRSNAFTRDYEAALLTIDWQIATYRGRKKWIVR